MSKCSAKIPFGEIPDGENSVWRKFRSAKILFDEISVRRKFRSAKIPSVKFPSAEIPSAKIPDTNRTNPLNKAQTYN